MKVLGLAAGALMALVSWKLGGLDGANSPLWVILLGLAGVSVFGYSAILLLGSKLVELTTPKNPALYDDPRPAISLPKVSPVEGLFVGCFGIPVVLFSVWFGWARMNPPDPAPAGNWVITASPALAPVNQAASNEMQALIRAKDVEGVQRLTAQGKILTLQKGTKMVLQAAGFAQHGMTVMDGPYAGRKCLVATEQVAHE